MLRLLVTSGTVRVDGGVLRPTAESLDIVRGFLHVREGNSPMSLRTAAETVDNRLPAPKCHVAILRLQLDDLDLKFLNDLLKSDKTSVYISEVVAADNRTLSEFSINRHRRRKCSCAE